MKISERNGRPLALAGIGLALMAVAAAALALLGHGPGISYTGSTANPSGSGALAALPAASRPEAQPLRFTGLDGRPLTLADFRGRTVLVNLWATWCPPCVSEMPDLDALQGTLGSGRFQVVAVSLDRGGTGAAERWFGKNGIRHLAVYNADPTQFPDAMLPTSFLIDAKGRVAWHGLGVQDWTSPTVTAEIRKIVAEDGAQ
ncbi:MAG: TlpA disulfide reductase family protein [Magnetospirillum sp.]|nr:TlpA disulfide reductase family protein [Magnetospirillum sp.]